MRKFLIGALASFALAATAHAQSGSAYVGNSTVTGTQAGADTIPVSNEVAGYAAAVVQFTSVGSGNTVTFEGSNDGLTWFTTPGYTLNGATHTGAVSPSTSVANVVPLNTRYWRMRISTYSSGTVTAVVSYKASGFDPSTVNAATVVGGNVASGATDSGNPVKVGGVYNSTKPTLTNGQRGDLQLGTRGALAVQIATNDGTSVWNTTVTNADAQNLNATQSMPVVGLPQEFNGSTWDRRRNNNDITVLASAARTTTTASSDLTNYNATGLHLVIEVTAASATPSVVCTIQGKDALGGAYYTILASAAITGISSNVYRVFPAATAAANAVANDIIPRTWRVNCVHADSDSITYSIGASVIQ